jgi:DNA primase catalytic subunit
LDPREHYAREEVKEEIASFLSKRWAAVEGRIGEEKVFARYLDNQPLWIKRPEDVEEALKRFPWARSFYGSIAVYSDKPLGTLEGITLFWDLDCEDDIEPCLKGAQIISSFLEKRGIKPWIKFSGRGFHVHVNEKCYNWRKEEDPFTVALHVERFVVSQLEGKLRDLELLGMKVETLIDPARVTTSPLSLHRELDRVAIAMKPEALGEFQVSWSEPKSYKHDPEAWRECQGSLEELVESAKSWKPPKPSKAVHPGRFPVMALLQAARYYIMTGDLERALSFGLNRAIFYAWLKYHYNPGRAKRPKGYSEEELKRIEKLAPVGPLKDKAPVSESGWFEIGGQQQKPEDFMRQVARRFEESGISFELAWEKAISYVSKFPEHVLKDPNLFFKYVYEPVRDDFLLVIKGEARASLPALYQRRGRTLTLDKFFKKTK